MLREEVNGPKDLERALKRLKKKTFNVGLLRQIRDGRAFTKPSVKNRQKKIAAIYRQQKRKDEGE